VKRIVAIIICFCGLSISLVHAQTIEVDCQSKPLNEILIEWRDRFDLQFSFNDAQLAQYRITIKQKFQTVDDALSALLKGLPFEFEKSRDVYIIYPVKRQKPQKTFTLIGKITEEGTGEPLPFSHIMANGQQAVTDVKGVFSFNFQDDSVYQITASHLGCYMLDTVLQAGINHSIILKPSAVGIKEVVVTNNIVEKSTQIGESSGLTSLNHHIANYLPGNGDNSVFNLLRLQPGILAAGEQPNDLIIWGSPEGTSRVTFDGFTIWGLKNFNDNISAVNPYLAKNIEVHKGGYDASHDDVIGGIVSITGKNGSTMQPGLNLFINNQTLNGMVELPFSRKSALMLAFRQTYYNLFSSDDLIFNQNQNNQDNAFDVIPDYNFRDFNLKYSLQGDNGDLFYMSLLHGADNFETKLEREIDRNTNKYRLVKLTTEIAEDNQQMGGTLFYGKTFANGNSSSLNISYSALYSNYSNTYEQLLVNTNIKRVKRDINAQNNVGELAFKWKNTVLAGEKNSLTFGAEFIHNNLVLTEDTFNTEYINLSERANRVNLFIQNRVQLHQRLSLTTGLRYNHSFFIDKIYFDPRIGLSYRASGNIKLNASWGRYHQYLVKSSVVDEYDNYRYTWTIADNREIPVMVSHHYVVNGAYTLPEFLFSIDAFYKENEGLTRFVRYKQNNYNINGISRSYGIDFYGKKDFKGHSVWASYSLSKTEEYYPFYVDERYRRALQDQRHEVKVAGLFNLGSFHLSASYIYGSGFPIYTNYRDEIYTEPDYKRLDASFIYKLSSQKFTGEVGISILNVFDADNLKYNQFNRVPIEQTASILINSDAVPFTPLLYLKLHF